MAAKAPAAFHTLGDHEDKGHGKPGDVHASFHEAEVAPPSQGDGLGYLVGLFGSAADVAEIDDGEHPSAFVPDWLDVVRDVSQDEAWTGARLAR